MQTPNKPSLLSKLEAMASRLGEAAKKALHKSNSAKKDAAGKVAEYEKSAKATIKEAKSVSKGNARSDVAKKSATKKPAAKKVASKTAAVKKVPAKTPAKKAAVKKPAAKKQAPSKQ